MQLFKGVLFSSLLVLSVLWISASMRAEQHFKKAQDLENKGQIEYALRHYQWAARAYYPFSTVGEKAVHRLWAIGQDFVKVQQKEQALQTFDLLRGAIWSTRWLLQPYQTYLLKVDQQIAKLRSGQISEEKLLRSLQQDPRPSQMQSFFILLSILFFLYSGISLLIKGMTVELEKTDKTYLYGGLLLGSGLCVLLSLLPY